MTRIRSVVYSGLAVLAAAVAFAFVPPGGPRSMRHFDAGRMAELELRMWQAYYQQQNARLFGLLVTMLHEQYNYPWAKATRAGFHLARAAATFGRIRGDYQQVLPDLERAYAIARDWTNGSYDVRAVARAELEWWVARRDPARSDPENVGRLIAREYALLYGVPIDRVAQAARLRAHAAALRDRGGVKADWPTVAKLLDESFRELRKAVGP